jgi:hypothetical protein
MIDMGQRFKFREALLDGCDSLALYIPCRSWPKRATGASMKFIKLNLSTITPSIRGCSRPRSTAMPPVCEAA